MTDAKNAYGYGREKLWQAVDALATGTGTIQERLESAATFLIRLRPPQNMMPKELEGEFEAILQDLTGTPAQGNQGTIRSTLRTMSNEEGSKLAQRIFSLYVNLRGGI